MRWHWQYTVPFMLSVFNVDWILMPLLQKNGIVDWWLFILTSILAITELTLWYWFWKWFRKVAILEFRQQIAKIKNKKVQEAIRVGTEIEAELKKTGLWDRIRNWFVIYIYNTFTKATDENNRFIKWVRRGRNIGMLILGISPEPGTRTFGAILCGAAGWKNGLYPLAIGNILRIAYMVGLWHIVFLFLKN